MPTELPGPHIYAGLSAKYHLHVSNFKRKWILPKSLLNTSNYNITLLSGVSQVLPCGDTEGRTDMAKRIVRFLTLVCERA